MKINYVLVYGTPYLKTAYFETFEDISKYLLKKSIVNYSIYEQMSDLKEVEMIHLENDVRVLEQENQSLKQQCEIVEKRLCDEYQDMLEKRNKLFVETSKLKDKIEKAIEKLNKLDFDKFVYSKTGLKDIKRDLLKMLGEKE